MKKISQTLLSLTVLVVIFFSESCSKDGGTTAPPPQAPTISSFNVSATGFATWSVSNATALTLSIDNGTAISVFGSSSFQFTGLALSSTHNATLTATNSVSSTNQTANFTMVGPTAVIITNASSDASASAILKSLPGNSCVKAIVLNVTTAGTAKLETIGTLTNGNNAIAYYWITNKDSAEVFQATSTWSPILAKTVAIPSQTINLQAGINVICFKTAAYNGLIGNGTQIGLKITLANNNVISNASYTADQVSVNQAGTVKIYLKLNNNLVISPNTQNTGAVYAYFQLFPYSDQNATTYDGAMYPSILSISYDTKNTSWFTGTFTGYSNLDFTNAAGGAGQNFSFSQDNNGTGSSIFQNSNATFFSGVLQFSKATGTILVKSVLGTFAWCSAGAYVYNPTSSTVGPFSVCWYLKSIRFVGNPELWIYVPTGNRIW